MNKKLIYSLIAGTLFTLTSCDDFLDVQPASGFTPEYIFSSESEMKALMTRIYSSMTEDGLYGSNLASGLNTNTDVEMSSFKNNTVSTNGSDIGCFYSRTTWSVLNATWNNIYYAINYANDFLQAVQESPLFSDKVTGDTPSETQQMYGEVKTLRAMLYLDLIRTWGDVVFIIKPTEATDDFFSLGTTDRNVILEYLIDDLIAVEPMMKYAVDLDYGVERASREYCQSLIGQLALYRGGWTLRADKEDVTHVGYMERGDNFEHYYEIAITYLGKVIKESKHDLTQSFENLWVNECNWKTANNDDVMFAVPMLKSVTSRYGYNIGVTIAEGKHSYGSARNYVTFCGTYVYSFDKDDLRRDMTCVPYKYDKDLTEHIGYENGMIICIESYFKQEPTRLMVETLEPSVVWELPKAQIEELASKYDDIEQLYRKFIEHSLIESQIKADALRFEPAHERYNKLLRLHPEILKRAPLVYIASLLQMTPETLSRVRSSLL